VIILCNVFNNECNIYTYTSFNIFEICYVIRTSSLHIFYFTSTGIILSPETYFPAHIFAAFTKNLRDIHCEDFHNLL